MMSAPRAAMCFALDTAFFPGHPPQETNPETSTGPVCSKASFPWEAILKSVVPGHMSSVCMQRMIPTFFIFIFLDSNGWFTKFCKRPLARYTRLRTCSCSNLPQMSKNEVEPTNDCSTPLTLGGYRYNQSVYAVQRIISLGVIGIIDRKRRRAWKAVS